VDIRSVCNRVPFKNLHSVFFILSNLSEGSGVSRPHWPLSCQKVSRKPNCNLRIELAEVITPKLVEVAPEGTDAPGCPRFTMLKILVPSARKRSLKRSLKLKSREMGQIDDRKLGPSRRLRGELPRWPPGHDLFWTKAAVLNIAPPLDCLCGDRRSTARVVGVPVELASTFPLVTVNGRPLRSLMIGEMLQPLRILRTMA